VGEEEKNTNLNGAGDHKEDILHRTPKRPRYDIHQQRGGVKRVRLDEHCGDCGCARERSGTPSYRLPNVPDVHHEPEDDHEQSRDGFLLLEVQQRWDLGEHRDDWTGAFPRGQTWLGHARNCRKGFLRKGRRCKRDLSEKGLGG
jgi:hypothetical protein